MSELNYIWPAIWQELTNHAAVILLYFRNDQVLAIDFFFQLLYILFLHHENTRNVVQGIPKILKFSQTHPPHEKSWLRACVLLLS